MEGSREIAISGKQNASVPMKTQAASDTTRANVARAKTSVRPVLHPLPHPHHRDVTVGITLRKADLSKGAVPPQRSSRSRARSTTKIPARIHRVTIGILLSVKSRKRRKAAVSATLVLVFMRRKVDSQRWKDRKRLHRHLRISILCQKFLGDPN